MRLHSEVLREPASFPHIVAEFDGVLPPLLAVERGLPLRRPEVRDGAPVDPDRVDLHLPELEEAVARQEAVERAVREPEVLDEDRVDADLLEVDSPQNRHFEALRGRGGDREEEAYSASRHLRRTQSGPAAGAGSRGETRPTRENFLFRALSDTS